MSDWFKIIVMNGKTLDKDFIIKSIANLSDVPFTPVSFTQEDRDAVFFVKGYRAARAIQSTSGRVTTLPAGTPMIVKMVQSKQMPPLIITTEVIEKLKIVMSRRYDTTTMSLDLSNFYNDKDLQSEGLYVQMHRTINIEALLKIVNEEIPQLKGLCLSNNQLSLLTSFSTLPKQATNLVRLNLSNNQLNNERELQVLRSLSHLEELDLTGNPLSARSKNRQVYVSNIRRIFPKLTKLDGQVLPPPVVFDLDDATSLPDAKGSHFQNDNIKDLVCRFIEQYFACYDNDQRQSLLAAYHSHAKFSLCTFNNRLSSAGKRSGLEEYRESSRNLKIVSSPGVRMHCLKRGSENIVKLLTKLSATQHDPLSFVVDVNLSTPTMLTFTINGVFKEKGSGSDKNLRQFSRTFITVPNGPGIAIVNEMLTVTNASAELYKKSVEQQQSSSSVSVAVGSVSQPSVGLVVVDPSSSSSSGLTVQQLQMIKQFSQQSGMNDDWSAKCLVENSWDFDKAGQSFQQLHMNGGIPTEAFLK